MDLCHGRWRFQGVGPVESDGRYYARRAAFEQTAAMRAVTPEARERRMQLAKHYASKAQECAGVLQPAI